MSYFLELQQQKQHDSIIFTGTSSSIISNNNANVLLALTPSDNDKTPTIKNRKSRADAQICSTEENGASATIASSSDIVEQPEEATAQTMNKGEGDKSPLEVNHSTGATCSENSLLLSTDSISESLHESLSGHFLSKHSVGDSSWNLYFEAPLTFTADLNNNNTTNNGSSTPISDKTPTTQDKKITEAAQGNVVVENIITTSCTSDDDTRVLLKENSDDDIVVTESGENSHIDYSFQPETTINYSDEGESDITTKTFLVETPIHEAMIAEGEEERQKDYNEHPSLLSTTLIDSLDIKGDQPAAGNYVSSIPVEEDVMNSYYQEALEFDKINNANGVQRVTKALFQEAIECLAESNLIYLLADLRLLSATGRIYTPYETINIDSDFVPKESVATITASPSSPLFSETRTARMKGISPAHIIAVLLIELRRELDFISTSNDKKMVKSDSLFSILMDPVGHKEFTKYMKSSMLWYSDMIKRDLLQKVPQIKSEVLRSRTKLTTSTVIERWQAHVKQNKNAISSMIHHPQNGFETGNSVQEPHIAARTATAEHLDNSSFNTAPKQGRSTLSPRINSSPVDRSSRTRLLKSSKKVARSILNNLQDKMNEIQEDNNKHKRQLKSLVTEFFEVGVSRTLGEAEILDFMEEAVRSRIHDRFQFLGEFFLEDTITKAMVQSKSKVVWLHDWYPLKELTYSVSVNQEKKRVLVVFRGCTTVSDWKHALDARWKKTPNPVKEDFRGKKEFIKLHRGFCQYLFRNRKDNNTCKYDEIANITDRYGKQIGDNYEVFVTGHSLGAAMATLFSFYASTEERFTTRGPVKCITFACPMIGGQAYADSFRYQERHQKLMLARFHNATDMCELIF